MRDAADQQGQAEPALRQALESDPDAGMTETGPSTIASSGNGPAPLQKRGRKPPRWTIAFLRGLERTGEVLAAAEDAGIDFSTVYARRKAHADFGEKWAAALAAHKARVLAEEEGSLEALETNGVGLAPPPSRTGSVMVPSPSSLARGEDIAAAGRLKRASPERWGKAKEQAFLAELMASANVRRAARAAGISTTALYRRRANDRRLAAAWDLRIEAGKARLQAMLVAAANAALDAGDLPDPQDSPLPPVTVREAIEIAKLKGPGDGPGGGRGGRSWIIPDDREPEEDEYRQACDSIIGKLERLGERDRKDKEAQGWAFDEGHGVMVPPGWGRPEQLAIGSGGPRAMAGQHCPLCGGGLTLSLVTVEGSAPPDDTAASASRSGS